ncbi:nucleotidyl transferase AbiEii/AbiGii toxin family protein [Porphyromonas gingivalis]|uniref:nucleotidyl transferase AbiEii/AbiGii toxin family protein n=1 Tax=Porphyromonas gingivalis TaxID=837 RepID=UPI0015CF5149|nr:nucleotidyl transferase AbiEii/AbiGii toxin family protein [Porphyromonas gingivalis]
MDNILLAIRELIASCDKFSVDLDFNLLDKSKEELVYNKVQKILEQYGRIIDKAMKYYGPIIVLDYGAGERKLKVEISNRNWEDHYEIKNLLGINMKVMVTPDMFAHKLCALLDRSSITNRDIFDCWFFMKNKIPINASLVEERMKMPLKDYLQKCINHMEKLSGQGLLNGLGELTEPQMKTFVRNKLKAETISLLTFYREFPIDT